MDKALMWFRRDLRLADQPALQQALQGSDALLCVYIDDAAGPMDASRAWLRRSLQALGEDIARRGGELQVLRGDAETLLPQIVEAAGITRVHASRLYEPEADARDERIARRLGASGVTFQRARGRVLGDAENIMTGAGHPYRVFTPFFRAAELTWQPRLQSPPPRIAAWPLPDALAHLRSDIAAPRPDWDAGFWSMWTPGEAGAVERLDSFMPRIDDYAQGRDVPGIDATSRLSPHLHFGEISPDAAWRRAQSAAGEGARKFIAELGWREFAYYVLQHWPHTLDENFDARFDALPWRSDPQALDAWRHGLTGVPLVDAGMRQLWQTGWMHNRVRMVVASYLTKHIGIDWRIGAAWFMHTLVDADLTSNTLGWQWVSGCGVDAAPYFRVFNPVLQSRKFDPKGVYLRRWLPELAALGDKAIHAPWEQGIRVPGYPARPVVDLAKGRERALAAFAGLKA